MKPFFFIRRTTCTRTLLPPRLRLRARRNQSSSSSPCNSKPAPEQKSSPSNLSSQSNSPVPSSPSPSKPVSPNTSLAPPTSTVLAASGSRSLREIIQAGPVGRLGKSYSRMQDRRPYVTQVCSSLVVYLFGDLSAQMLFPSEPSSGKSQEGAGSGEQDDDAAATTGGSGYDPWRTLRHLTVGVGSSIPSYNWFMFLHNNFNFASKFLSILTKVTVQQIVFTPVFNTYFFSVQSLLSGASLEETFERLKVALPVSITNSAKLWPAVTAFSFMYVPPQFRSVFSGVIAVGWQTYLSWLNQKAAREVEAELAESASSAIALSSAAATLKA